MSIFDNPQHRKAEGVSLVKEGRISDYFKELYNKTKDHIYDMLSKTEERSPLKNCLTGALHMLNGGEEPTTDILLSPLDRIWPINLGEIRKLGLVHIDSLPSIRFYKRMIKELKADGINNIAVGVVKDLGNAGVFVSEDNIKIEHFFVPDPIDPINYVIQRPNTNGEFERIEFGKDDHISIGNSLVLLTNLEDGR